MNELMHIVKTDGPRPAFRPPSGAIAAILCTLLYVVITYNRSELIGAGAASLFWSLVCAIRHLFTPSSLPDPGLIEYWIASAAWCALGVLQAVWYIRRMRSAEGPVSEQSSAWHEHPVSVLVLGLFATAAVCAPIIAPLPPLAQGDLQHTRFLPPLSAGVSTYHAPDLVGMESAGYPERKALEAGTFLLRRTVEFSGTEAGTAPIGARASSVMFLFGTDAVGRDIFSRVVYGSRYSIGIGITVVLISVLFGSSVGMIAGYKGGAMDSLFMRTIDILMSIPSLFLVLTLMALLGQSVAAMVIVLSATEWMGAARIVRGEVMHLRGREFISASRLLGTSWTGILKLHMVPNVRPAIVNIAVLQLGNIFLAEASLSFLGLGIMAPEPSWGNMIADSMAYGHTALAGGIFPGIALSSLIVAVHVIGGTER